MWGDFSLGGKGDIGVCTMWESVPPALGHNLVCLLCDTTLNGDKALASHYFINSMSCRQVYSICIYHGSPFEGAAHVPFLLWMPREGTSTKDTLPEKMWSLCS